MTVLKLTAERPPRILLPARIADQRTVGELKGYYVRNTNSYNVPPVDPAAQVDPQRVDSIGYLLPLNPFDCIREELRPQLRRLETGEVASGDIAGRLRASLEGFGHVAQPPRLDAAQLAAETADFIARLEPALTAALAARLEFIT